MNNFDEENVIDIYDGVPDNIIDKHEEWENLYKKLNQKLISKGLPMQAVFEITPLCNLKCKMCFIRLDKEQMDSIGKLMTAAQWKDITEQTAEMGVHVILITGGEPFVHPEFVEIYENIMKTGFRVILFTNAVILNDKIIEILKKYPPHYLYVTVYGASEETYEKVCGNGKAYYSVMKNIKILKDMLTNIPITLRTTIIKDNLKDVGELKKLSEEMHMKFSFSFGLIKPVRGAKCDGLEEMRLSPEELVNMRKNYLKFIKNKASYDLSIKGLEIYKKKMLEYDGKSVEITEDKRKYNCVAAYQVYTISWDGKMLPCQTYSSPYTLPLEIGVRAAWNELRKTKNSLKIPVRCMQCKYRYYCGSCPATIQAESGTIVDGEPYKCMKSLQSKI